MSFNRVHTAEETIDGKSLWLGVYADGSANLIIDDKEYITIDSDESEYDIEASHGVRMWLDRELTRGRLGCP